MWRPQTLPGGLLAVRYSLSPSLPSRQEVQKTGSANTCSRRQATSRLFALRGSEHQNGESAVIAVFLRLAIDPYGLGNQPVGINLVAAGF